MQIKVEQSKKLYHIDGTTYEGKITKNSNFENGINITTNFKVLFIPFVQINRIETLYGVEEVEEDIIKDGGPLDRSSQDYSKVKEYLDKINT